MNGNQNNGNVPGAQGIFALLTAPGASVLRGVSERAPDGRFLVEIVKSGTIDPNARSGAGVVMEYRVIGVAPGSPAVVGRVFSSVPKTIKTPEASAREMADFVIAAEGPDPHTGMIRGRFAFDQNTLAQLVHRAFYEGANPYQGMRVFVTTKAVTTRGGYPYVRHQWEGASEALANAGGIAWPAAGFTPVPTGAPSAPTAPAQAPRNPSPPIPQAPRPGMPPAAPQAPAAPNYPPAPAAPAATPPRPPAPPAAMPPPPPVPARLPPAPGAPGWFLSNRFPGWYVSDDSDADSGVSYYNPATGETTSA